MAERDWVSDFHALAARGAQLLGVRGEFFDGRRSAEEALDWPAGWLRAIAAPKNYYDQNWPSTLWFAFTDSPILRFELDKPAPWRELRLTLEESLPAVTNEPRPQTRFAADISELPPFSAVVGTNLEAISILACLQTRVDENWERKRASRRPGSVRWDERLPDDSPVGIRLMFERGDVWLLNLSDEMAVFDRRPPFWEEEARQFDLREWEHPA